MADWDNLRYFVTLARRGTFLKAAKELGVDHATVSRRVSALEGELGVRLVDRRGKRLSLTPAGTRIAALAGEIAGQIDFVTRVASKERTEISGEVGISAPPAFAAAMLAEPLVNLRRAYPGLLLRVRGETHYASLGQREADIAIRLERPTAGSIMASKVGIISFHLYGNPEYLASTDPSDRSFIGYDEELENTSQQQAVRREAGGAPLSFKLNTIELQLALTRAGGGVAMLPDFLAAPDPVLARVSKEAPVTREVWLTFHTELKNSGPVRLVADRLRDHLLRQLR